MGDLLEALRGELLISEATWGAAQIENKELEIRNLELKGKSDLVRVRVLDASENGHFKL